MDVMVTKECPRCSKKSTSSVSLEEAVQMESVQAAKAAEFADLEARLAETLSSMQNLPTLLVAARNPDGRTFTVKALGDLCAGPRSCSTRVTSLLNEVFVPVKQTPKKKDAESPEVPDANG